MPAYRASLGRHIGPHPRAVTTRNTSQHQHNADATERHVLKAVSWPQPLAASRSGIACAIGTAASSVLGFALAKTWPSSLEDLNHWPEAAWTYGDLNNHVLDRAAAEQVGLIAEYHAESAHEMDKHKEVDVSQAVHDLCAKLDELINAGALQKEREVNAS